MLNQKPGIFEPANKLGPKCPLQRRILIRFSREERLDPDPGALLAFSLPLIGKGNSPVKTIFTAEHSTTV
jgi:hypothetical protein